MDSSWCTLWLLVIGGFIVTLSPVGAFTVTGESLVESSNYQWGQSIMNTASDILGQESEIEEKLEHAIFGPKVEASKGADELPSQGLTKTPELTDEQTQVIAAADKVTESCSMCPGSTWSRHSGYQAFAHWTGKPGAENLLPRSYCPRMSRTELVREAVVGIAAAGFIETAKMLNSSGILLNATGPVTVLAPTNFAYLPRNLPVFLDQLLKSEFRDTGVLRNLMRHHVLEDFLTYDDLFKGRNALYMTSLQGSQVECRVYSRDGLDIVKVRSAQSSPAEHMAVVVKRDLFCNAHVIVHGINQVLIPPMQFLPAGTPPAPLFLKQRAQTLRVLNS